MFGLLMSMLAYLLSQGGLPAAIEGSIPLKMLDESIAAGRRKVRDFGTACPDQKMFRSRRLSAPHGNLNSGTPISR
jgi:hypothetical protein